MTITIRPDNAAKCWLATFAGAGFPEGTYPLPFTADAPAHAVRSNLQAKFPQASVRHVAVVR